MMLLLRNLEIASPDEGKPLAWEGTPASLPIAESRVARAKPTQPDMDIQTQLDQQDKSTSLVTQEAIDRLNKQHQPPPPPEDDQSLLIETSSCTPVLFRTNYYSIEIPHGVTAISLTYHPHHAKLQVLPNTNPVCYSCGRRGHIDWACPSASRWHSRSIGRRLRSTPRSSQDASWAQAPLIPPIHPNEWKCQPFRSWR